ncbi:MAG: bifunctional diaminohydroxyphosphoribosylaminopyrimidine deaminase/5-amino-6-(5-phosphoribosylamino)uracil reductase RibD [Bacteriovoracaceae bacterium]|nr:bifunctional diaminohydroxyphosphoribosylaminopyrimidine deaminase/5-amino-6-(5-phosphoribosylamino)uracil reductase RibD [Bacteriovoracaceae bacterium]
MSYETWMEEALNLALQGQGHVAPNPLVGAVVVKNNKVIGRGYHQKYGGPHAEVEALENCSENPKGATLICNLEPCCHTLKQTPPCVDLIIKLKIKMVVVACLDPNPQVCGKGIQKLREHGIEVLSGVLQKKGEKINKFFFKYIQTGLPFVTLKMAQTLDGKIASSTGDSRWITDEKARLYVHQMRSQYDAILVGAGTLKEDNPKLNVRLEDFKGKQPYRIVVGDVLKMNPDAEIFHDDLCTKTIIATPQNYNLSVLQEKFIRSLQKRGVHLLEVEKDAWGNVSLLQMLQELGKMKITSVLVEGGSEIYTSFLRQNLCDEIITFIAPLILGEGKNTFASLGIDKVSDAFKLNQIEIKTIGEQVVMSGVPEKKKYQNNSKEYLCLQA